MANGRWQRTDGKGQMEKGKGWRAKTSLRRQGDAEVAEHVAPDGVNVIGAVLGLVELDQKGGALNAIGVRLGAIGGACPGELDAFGTGLADLVKPGLGDLAGHVGGVRFDDPQTEPIAGNEVPVEPFWVIKPKRGLLGLALGQRIQESLGGNDHPAARLIDVGAGIDGDADHGRRGENDAGLDSLHVRAPEATKSTVTGCELTEDAESLALRLD